MALCVLNVFLPLVIKSNLVLDHIPMLGRSYRCLLFLQLDGQIAARLTVGLNMVNPRSSRIRGV